MADTVTTKIRQTADRYWIHITGVSDGTGESDVAKIDKSSFTDRNAAEAPFLRILAVAWSISGFSRVVLETDHTTDDTMLVLAPGNGYRNYEHVGGLFDPNSAGGTGDLLLTSSGAASGATYDIDIEVAR